LNTPEKIRVSEAVISLSAVTKVKENRSAAAGAELWGCMVFCFGRVRERNRHPLCLFLSR